MLFLRHPRTITITNYDDDFCFRKNEIISGEFNDLSNTIWIGNDDFGQFEASMLRRLR